jgi:[CysO sulfur-carrier protein]-S-L-cysteine hydrolase
MVELKEISTRLILTENQRRSMLADVQLRAPEEACGLLGGKAYRVFAVVPVTNIARSNTRYLMEPGEQLRAFQQFEREGLEISGIYHSHPSGPNHPSNTDLEEAYYPDAVYLIWSSGDEGWECRAFRMKDGLFQEVEILIADL